jgi:hypothetical protein
VWRGEQADTDLEGLRVICDDKGGLNKREKSKVDRLHVELERLNGTLRQIEGARQSLHPPAA